MSRSDAQDLLELVADLDEKVNESFGRDQWSNDLQYAQAYLSLVQSATSVLPSDAVLMRLPRTIPSEFQGLNDPSKVLTWVRFHLGLLKLRLAQRVRSDQPSAALQGRNLDLGFMKDDGLKSVAALDFAEAQNAFAAGAPKSAALLGGSALEAILLDVLRRPEIESDARFEAFLRRERLGTAMNWDRASLGKLLGLAYDFGMFGSAYMKLASGTVDFRDCVHPMAELRWKRPESKDASILLQIVDLLVDELHKFHRGTP